MKVTIIAVVVAVVLFSFTSSVVALPEPINKLKGGVMDIVSAPLEMYTHSAVAVKAADFKPFGLIGGLLKGTAYTIKKAGSGVVDIVTFPVNLDD